MIHIQIFSHCKFNFDNKMNCIRLEQTGLNSVIRIPSIEMLNDFNVGSMGVSILFSRGGQNFPGGQKHTICIKNTKNILFSSKKPKKILFWSAREGQGPLWPSSADAHGGEQLRSYRGNRFNKESFKNILQSVSVSPIEDNDTSCLFLGQF